MATQPYLKSTPVTRERLAEPPETFSNLRYQIGVFFLSEGYSVINLSEYRSEALYLEH